MNFVFHLDQLSIIEFLLQNSSESSDGYGPLDKEENTLLHLALNKSVQSPDVCRLIVRKYTNCVTRRNLHNFTPSQLVK